MKDPDEGLTAEGFIRTGIRRERIPDAFEPVIEATIGAIETLDPRVREDGASLYVYGSDATGTAITPTSDVDFITVGIAAGAVGQISDELSLAFASICRGVEIASATSRDFDGEGDEAYGGRVFLHHYCLLLSGQGLVTSSKPFAGDTRAARGFNGDIGAHYARWCVIADDASPEQLGRKIARKTLLAVAGLISVHDRTWTTDRASSAARWIELNPTWLSDCSTLLQWSDGSTDASRAGIIHLLAPGGLRSTIVDEFQSSIGLWV